MVICIEQWGGRIDLVVARPTKGKSTAYHDLNIISCKVFVLIIILFLANDYIESNPKPKQRTSNYFSRSH